MGEVSRARSDVEDFGGRVKVWEEGLGGCDMHVWGGNGSFVADCLGGVFVGGSGAVMRAVNLGVKEKTLEWNTRG